MKKLKKIIVINIIVIFLVNIVLPDVSFAETDLLDGLVVGLDGLLGIVLYPLKILFLVPGVLANLGLKAIVAIGETGSISTVTLDQIFYNKYNITNINIFDIEGAGENLQLIRQSIAGFYYSLRNLAIVLSLAVLIYIGIQMAINSIAQERAKYKQMLYNWVVGFGLIFILHYIIIFTINANEILVNALYEGVGQQTSYYSGLLEQVWWIPFTTSFASLIIYDILIVITFIFLIMYIKRMLTISFLVIVAPLISVTYSIDKIDNNRSEILNTWLREFLYNVLIQPFHCIIYSVFIGTAMSIISEPGQFGAMVLSIILTLSIFLAQKIIREIFGFNKASTLSDKIVAFAIAKQTISTVKTVAGIAKKGSKNDNVAQKNIKKLPKKMPDGSDTTLENMERMRALAEKNRQDENKGKARNTTNTRPMKNWNPTVKRMVRGYKDLVFRTNGIYIGKNVLEKMRRERRTSQMTNADFFIAGSESFRQSQQNAMTNNELAQKMEKLYDTTQINTLTPEELNYKLLIENMKSQYSKQEMIDFIKNGTSDNKRWRK